MTPENLRFDVLGPMTVQRGDTPVNIGTHKARAVLALLLTRPNRTVSLDSLIDALWADAPPRSAVKNVQVYIHQLRRALGSADRIVHQSPGYRLVVLPGELDAEEFTQLAQQGREATDPKQASGLFQQALHLWKSGDAYADLQDVPELAVESARLAEACAVVLDDRIDAELELGHAAELVPELSGLTAKYPLREGLWARLMTALFRAGRQAEALDTYQRARQVLAEEAGLDPGAELQAVQREILAAQQESVEPEFEAPRMLPPDLADFTGRTGELAAAEAALRAGARVIAISGGGGLGKTALAVHLAHRLAGEFGGGQLCCDLRGAQPEPVEPVEVLGRFLRALGVPGVDQAEDLEARAARYRSLLAQRRMLVVLDNAADEAQLRPLLPGAGEYTVIVTSRARLGGLSGVHPIDLDVLAEDDGRVLLERITRSRHDAGEAAELVRLCAGLPLAIRIAGAKLATRPHWRLSDVVSRLRDERRRLDTLRYRDLAVRASFALSYHGLSPPAKRLFRLVGLVDAPDFAAWTAAAVVDADSDEIAEPLDEVIDARLVEFTDGRYRLHDLVRVFARERAAEEETAEARTEALNRAAGGWLALTDAAHLAAGNGAYAAELGRAQRWRPDLATAGLTAGSSYTPGIAEALALAAAVAQSARLGRPDLAWELALGGVPLFQQGNFLDEWRSSQEIAFAACQAAGDRRGQAAMWYVLGLLHGWHRRHDRARTALETAIGMFDELGDGHGSALALRSLAVVERSAGRLTNTIDSARRAYELLRELGDPGAAADALVQVGVAYVELDDPDAALGVLAEATAQGTAAGAVLVRAQGLYWSGMAHLRRGRIDEARAEFDRFYEFVRMVGAARATMYAQHAAGLLGLAEGALDQARSQLEDAVATARQVRDPLMLARALHALAQALADPVEAGRCLGEALEISERLDLPLWQARTQEALGRLAAASGDTAAARPAWERARELYQRIGSAKAEEITALLGQA